METAPLDEGQARRLSRACGVARVARVTGLDRAGVEVACAIRPGGHVLQVTNGKGLTFAVAAAGALLEAAELCGAERVDAAQLVFAAAEEVGEAALDPRTAGPVVDARLVGRRVRIAWRRARDLYTGAPLLVPAALVHCPPEGAALLGPAGLQWSSNGMGAHPERAAALLHALLEAAERDGLARALPGGWTRAALARRQLAPETLAHAAPRAASLVRDLARAGLRTHLFWLDPAGDRSRSAGVRPSRPADWLGLPLAGALLIDEEEGPVPLTAGYACRLGRDEALVAALLEAAQSRLTDVHGAREDVAPPDRAALRALSQACLAAPARVNAGDLPDLHEGNAEAGVALVLRRLRAAGQLRAAAVELAPPGFPVAVIKVVVPGLLLSELL